MFELVNRAIIVVKPREPFLDWANSVDDEIKTMTIEEMEDDSAVFLIQDFERDEEKEEILQKHYKAIFEAALNGWVIDKSLWPEKRDYSTFKQWFQIVFHSIVFDLQDDDYLIEEAEG